MQNVVDIEWRLRPSFSPPGYPRRDCGLRSAPSPELSYGNYGGYQLHGTFCRDVFGRSAVNALTTMFIRTEPWRNPPKFERFEPRGWPPAPAWSSSPGCVNELNRFSLGYSANTKTSFGTIGHPNFDLTLLAANPSRRCPFASIGPGRKLVRCRQKRVALLGGFSYAGKEAGTRERFRAGRAQWSMDIPGKIQSISASLQRSWGGLWQRQTTRAYGRNTNGKIRPRGRHETSEHNEQHRDTERVEARNTCRLVVVS